MSGDNLQQLAERLARQLKVGRTCQPPASKATGWPDFYADVPWQEGVAAILSALQSAYRQGQRETLEQAADAYFNETKPQSRAGRSHVQWWLRARASALEGGTEKP